jgi:hypothetical protein
MHLEKRCGGKARLLAGHPFVRPYPVPVVMRRVGHQVCVLAPAKPGPGSAAGHGGADLSVWSHLELVGGTLELPGSQIDQLAPMLQRRRVLGPVLLVAPRREQRDRSHDTHAPDTEEKLPLVLRAHCFAGRLHTALLCATCGSSPPQGEVIRNGAGQQQHAEGAIELYGGIHACGQLYPPCGLVASKMTHRIQTN